MLNYIYDSTFDGLLCTLSVAFKEGSNFTISPSSENQMFIDSLSIDIVTDKSLAEKTYIRMEKRWGKLVLQNIYKGFLYPQTENLIALYISLLMKSSSKELVINHPSLIDFEKRILKISREIHRWHGFLRFKELQNGFFYSSYEPDYDLTPLIIPHFASRFKNQSLIIHDTKRNYGAFYQNKEIFYSRLDNIKELPLSKNEEFYQKGWKVYFESLAIESRKNPKLQMSMMPKKYWRFLIEKREGDS